MNLYLASATSKWEAQVLCAARPFMPEAKRERIERSRAAQQRTSMALGELLLAWALFESCGESAHPDERCEGPHGKPMLCGAGKAARLEFNLSHSGTYVLVGIDEHPLGVDIQLRDRGDVRLARKVMPDDAFEQWVDAKDKTAAFCDFWVRRESELKWWGIGISALGRDDLVLPEGVELRAVQAPHSYSAAVCGTLSPHLPAVLPAREIELAELLAWAAQRADAL